MLNYKGKSNSKYLKHLFLYFLEMVIATTTTTIRTFLEGSGALLYNSVLINILKDYVFAYTLYQLVLIAAFKLKDSIEIDALTSLKNESDRFQIYAEFKNKIPQAAIDKMKNYLTENPKVMLKNEHRVLFEHLTIAARSYNSDDILPEEFRMRMKQFSREMDHQIKVLGFTWMNSILLRIMK
ncbi:hypothetical protein LOZ80_39000 [Paenibacillus sp. HWE-109]|uniref:hypothetical protein n=1 Tax=Paenibacillus sp. HWE-109 TaxID=1306526 RepID=UPI001EDD8447|nr:hypothetical protein [Paenibacillus sp. HWE-109]UKS27355.1 hypothetical protein LOZ80_39000 [Paenibacillus sp. HWE-109]